MSITMYRNLSWIIKYVLIHFVGNSDLSYPQYFNVEDMKALTVPYFYISYLEKLP